MNLKSNLILTILSFVLILSLCVNIVYKRNMERIVKSNEIVWNEMHDKTILKEIVLDDLKENFQVLEYYLQNPLLFRPEKIDCKYPILIYSYSQKDCDMCVRKDLVQLSKLQKNVGENRICVFTSFEKNRNNEIKLKNELTSLNFINRKQDNELNRYFAVIDNEGSISMVFFPKKDMPEISDCYMELVKNFLLKY